MLLFNTVNHSLGSTIGKKIKILNPVIFRLCGDLSSRTPIVRLRSSDVRDSKIQ